MIILGLYYEITSLVRKRNLLSLNRLYKFVNVSGSYESQLVMHMFWVAIKYWPVKLWSLLFFGYTAALSYCSSVFNTPALEIVSGWSAFLALVQLEVIFLIRYC